MEMVQPQGVHLYGDSIFEGENVNIFANGSDSGAFHLVDGSEATVNGLLNTKLLGMRLAMDKCWLRQRRSYICRAGCLHRGQRSKQHRYPSFG